MIRNRLSFVSLVLACCACGGVPQPPADGSSDSALADRVGMDGSIEVDATVPVDVPGLRDAVPELVPVDAPSYQYTVSIGPIRLTPTQEGTWCILRRLPNPNPQYLRRTRIHLGPASHHLIFYASPATVERTTPFPCRGFSGVRSLTNFETPLAIAQQTDTTVSMPDSPPIGMGLGAMQMVRLEFHAINTTAAPMDAMGTVTVDTTDRTPAITRGDIMFWGNTRLSLPARSRTRVDFFALPLSGSRIFALTSHTHQLGTLATISVAMQGPTPDPTMVTDLREVHRSINWAEPPLTQLDPPLLLPSAQGLHLVCNYNNTTSATVTFGEDFNQEMCFMWGYYWPGRGTHFCVDDTGVTICVPLMGT